MAPPALMRYVGSTLVGLGDTTRDLDDLRGPNRVIGLYFAAAWHPSSKCFCAQVTQLQEHLRQASGPHLEVVLVSRDEDEAAFRSHLDGLPWVAVPFNDTRRRVRLARQHHATSLPLLVLLDGRTGKTLSRVTPLTLSNDPTGVKFPWQPDPLGDLLKTAQLRDPQGKIVDRQSLKNSFLGLYFSANWCPPCKAFSPHLISSYEAIKKGGHEFEVIFVSSDRSEDSFKAYHSSMPWLAIDWGQDQLRQELADALDVKGIPSLVILNPNLSVITTEGRAAVNEDPTGKKFPWEQQSVEFLGEEHMPILLERPCLVLFTDGEESEVQFAKDVLLPVAEEYFATHPDEGGMSLGFFVAGEDDVSESLREAASLEDVHPLVAIIDITERVKYVLEKGVEISSGTVHNFVMRYTSDALEAHSTEYDCQSRQSATDASDLRRSNFSGTSQAEGHQTADIEQS